MAGGLKFGPNVAGELCDSLGAKINQKEIGVGVHVAKMLGLRLREQRRRVREGANAKTRQDWAGNKVRQDTETRQCKETQ